MKNEKITLLEKKRLKLSVIILVIGMFFLITGVTLAIFSYSNTGQKIGIKPGTLTFTYLEGENSLNIVDDEYKTDEVAKVSDEYYQFAISANVTSPYAIKYYVYYTIDTLTEFDKSDIKMYLTKVDSENGSIASEKIVLGPTLASEIDSYDLTTFTVDNTQNNYVLDQGTFNFDESNKNITQTKYYRFRMWVNKDLSGSYLENNNEHSYSKPGGKFKIKINVIGMDGEIVTS